MILNNPIFINQTDADIRYVNTTGDAVNGVLSVTGLTISGLGTPFTLKSPNNTDSITFNPTLNGNAGGLFANWIYCSNMGSVGDNNYDFYYGGAGSRAIRYYGMNIVRALLDANGNFGIASGISSVPSRFYVSGNSILQGDTTISGNATITGHLSAASKSFLINHPTQANKKLQYGSLESPYHGIRLTDKNKLGADSVKVNLRIKHRNKAIHRRCRLRNNIT